MLFNFGDLSEDFSGPQALLMENAYHRAVLRLILRRTEDFKQDVMQCLRDLRVNGRKMPAECPFKKDPSGLWEVPPSGCIEFRLCLDLPPVEATAEKHLLTWHNSR